MNGSRELVDGETVVVGIDGSINSDAALDWAIDEASKSARRVLAAHVLPFTQSVVIAPLVLVGFPDATSSAAELLRRASQRCRRADVAVSTTLVEGSPAHRLAELSEGAAMLVLGTRGLGQAVAAVLGSVSRDCARMAKCPFVLVPPPASSSPGRTHDSTDNRAPSSIGSNRAVALSSD